ncbi:hypothetical protein OPV22_018510 [Ensete ventricosum]|uniref:Uncharacterized protein n=1 Tax=Ensete ventricosum TaxID=4639 RepID=A0AAV8PGB0_ENSVE|nr:hypothetical protein OPV22_018510 [Ensete ventricosum]
MQSKEFISNCEALELVPAEELEFSSQERAETQATQRAKKIAHFKHQRGAEAKLQEIKEEKERYQRSLRGAARSSPVEAGEEDVLDDDGEEEREAWLTSISLSICKAFDLLFMLKKVEEMLIAVKEQQSKGGEDFASETPDEQTKQAETWHRDAASQAAFSNLSHVRPLLRMLLKVGRSFHKHEHNHQSLVFGPARSLSGGRLTSERKNDSPSLPTRS